MPVCVLVVVYGLAVARLTGLVTDDEITRAPRESILKRLDDKRSGQRLAGYLITCQWCASIYVAAVVAPLAWFHGHNPWLAIPALALAFSQFTGMFSAAGRG